MSTPLPSAIVAALPKVARMLSDCPARPIVQQADARIPHAEAVGEVVGAGERQARADGESKAERAVAVPDGAAIECRPAGDRQDIVAAAIGRDRAAGAGE
jgi:hypothetical protein